jgi:DNA-binding MurR/RpiR family transcriptional regulator
VTDASIADLVLSRREALTRAERRVADVVLEDPEAVAFGTVAEVARRAGTSGATVVRLGARLGFDGFSALQDAVRAELAHRLRPATERIRETDRGDVLSSATQLAVRSVDHTLGQADPAVFARVVERLSARRGRVWLLSGDEADAIGAHFGTQLRHLGVDVRAVTGNPVRVAATLAEVAGGDTVVAIDLRRYDRWLVEALDHLSRREVTVVGVSDSRLSPVASRSDLHFVADAEGSGPFDSYVGVLALLEALAAAVARRRRSLAADRIDAIEAAWHESAALLDD